jgi:hypothetical protein
MVSTEVLEMTGEVDKVQKGKNLTVEEDK